MKPQRTDDGTAIVEFVWLALVLLVPLVYLLLAVFDTQRTAYAASAAARSAGRAFVTAPDQGSAYARANEAARLAFADQGIREPHILRIVCRPDPDACLTPGSVVEARVASRTRLPLIPAVLGRHTPSIAVSATHQAPYGSFREARP